MNHSTLQSAAVLVLSTLEKCYEQSINTPDLWIVTILDSRFKLHIVKFIYETKGGEDPRAYHEELQNLKSSFKKDKSRADRIRIHSEEEMRDERWI